MVLAVGVVMILLALVLSPDSDTASSPVSAVVTGLRHAGAPRWLTSARLWGAVFNVILFMPVGVIGVMIRPRWPLWRWLLVGLVVSGSIELFQGLFLPGRDADPVDVMTNTAGTVIGAWATRAVRRRSSERPGDRSHPF